MFLIILSTVVIINFEIRIYNYIYVYKHKVDTYYVLTMYLTYLYRTYIGLIDHTKLFSLLLKL